MGSPLHTPTSIAQGSQRPHLHPSTGFLTGVKRVNMSLKRRVRPEPWRPSRGSPAPGCRTRQPGRGVCCVAPDLTQYPFRLKPRPEDKPTCEFCPSSCYLAGGARTSARSLPQHLPRCPGSVQMPWHLSPSTWGVRLLPSQTRPSHAPLLEAAAPPAQPQLLLHTAGVRV